MATKLPFEKIFPYFSYRWRYKDGEYSPYAPFSKVAFFPKDPNVEDFFKKGHNTSMANNLASITLNNIGRGGPDVVAVDILYTESISSTVYILKTIELAEIDRGVSEFLDPPIVISERSFETALPVDQLNRQFDNVPLKAQAQEVTANRLMYGNYTHKFDQNNNLAITLGTTTVAEPLNGPSIKSNRTYDVGIAFIDKFGRIGNIITQKTQGPDSTEGSTIKTDFSLTFRTLLTATIDKEKFAAPDWAKYYRYYVKDVSGQHFNLSAFNVYNDGSQSDNNSDNVYIQFPSSDRNKITEESILIPKRHNFDGVDSIFTTESRHPVLDIENESPDIVKNQIVERAIEPVAEILDSNGRIANKTFVHNSSSSTAFDFPTVINDTSLVVQDESKPAGFSAFIRDLNNYIRDQDSSPSVLFDQSERSSSPASQTVNVSSFGERLCLRLKPNRESQDTLYKTDLVLVDSIDYIRIQGEQNRNAFKFTLSNRIGENGEVLSGNGLSKGGHTMQTPGIEATLKLYKLGLSDAGQEKLKGTFFVKVPRETADASITTLPTGQTPFDEDGKVEGNNIKEINFETEPVADSNLNLYWEGSKTYTIEEDYGQTNTIEFANCIGTGLPSTSQQHGKIYLESTKLFDKFNTVEIVKGIRVTTPETRYAEETRKSGIIFSGLFNSKTGVNELNQFNMSLNPTKELEPNYGGIQKLYTLDTNLLALTEDKIFKILADKDALFNADDGVNVTATNLVLGQAMAYQGDFGISTHPESFAFFNNTAYFTDAKRGVVLQLSPTNGQIFPISSLGMANFFRDRLGALNTNAKLIGSFDGYKKHYLISIQGYNQNATSIGSETIPSETSEITLAYSQRAKGWTSRFSFVPEFGITSNSKFYTFKNGQAYLHNSDSQNRNTFYNPLLPTDSGFNAATGFTASEVQIIFNDNPTLISDWLSLNYEGGEGWEAVEIIGDQDGTYNITNVRLLDSEESGFLGWFFKEGKYHGAIVGTQPLYAIQAGQANSLTDFVLQATGSNEDISGTKGFFQKTRLRNSSLTVKELFAVSSEYYISQT